MASDFDILHPGMGRRGTVGGREADHEEAVPGELGRFGEGLGEGKLGFEVPGRKVALVVEAARVGDPLVDEDEAGSVFVEQLAQDIARVSGQFVVLGDSVVGLPAA